MSAHRNKPFLWLDTEVTESRAFKKSLKEVIVWSHWRHAKSFLTAESGLFSNRRKIRFPCRSYPVRAESPMTH